MQLIMVSHLCMCACVCVYSVIFFSSSMISYDERDKIKLTGTQTVCNVCESSPELTVKILQDLLHLDFHTDNHSESPSRQSTPGSPLFIYYASTLKMSELQMNK